MLLPLFFLRLAVPRRRPGQSIRAPRCVAPQPGSSALAADLSAALADAERTVLLGRCRRRSHRRRLVVCRVLRSLFVGAAGGLGHHRRDARLPLFAEPLNCCSAGAQCESPVFLRTCSRSSEQKSQEGQVNELQAGVEFALAVFPQPAAFLDPGK